MGETLLKVKRFNYTVIKEIPLTSLNLKYFKNHKRLKVFYHKGTQCVECNKKGTRLILGLSSNGQLHWDVYTKDLCPITVDHIIPKSKGGSEELSNKQPMCTYCNSKKGNGDTNCGGHFCKWPRIKKGFQNIPKNCIGLDVWIKKGKKFKPLGIISKTIINPHNNQLSAMIVGNDVSMYSLKSLFTEKHETSI